MESGTSSGSIKRSKIPAYDRIDKAVLDWFTAARGQNMPISGVILKEKAMEFAKRFGEDNFKASTGWLDKWKQRHDVSHKKACGESNDVRDEDCDKWRADVLPGLLEKYSERDIFNADETGLFFKCLPDKTLTFKNEPCHGGKNSKQRDYIEVDNQVCTDGFPTDDDILEKYSSDLVETILSEEECDDEGSVDDNICQPTMREVI
ncbi:hypothetical protein ACLKA6_001182 [Drosophila palustris]